MRLRRMVIDDVAAVVAVEVAATAFPWNHSQFVASLLENDDATVVEVEDDVAGFALFRQVLDESTLLNIAVHPDHQRSGYGRLLLERGLLAQAAKGVDTCFLEVRVSNERAQALYRSLGFAIVGERKNYYPAKQGREHALIMSRHLPENLLGET